MSEHFPKIHSLSTLNIKQHFNCDYRFHPFRTDFSGDSGSGKSLIADFIQLLIVGSGVFKSGTEGVKQRDTSGLALKSAGTKYGRGYLLMNVEVKPHKYLTLGGYLETSSSQMQFFIVQAGYDLEQKLVPLDQPIHYKDILVNGQIETVDRLQQVFIEKGYLRVLTTKKYHQILFENSILAVDLAQSKQNLKSYASIIRAFSRGKGFHTDSDSLKTFLFGDEDHKKLIERYREEVQSIHLDVQQHQRLQEEIDLIRSKEKLIAGVASTYKTFETLKQQFVRDSASFWQLTYDRLKKENQILENQCQEVELTRILINQKLFTKIVDDLHEQAGQISQLSIKARQSNIDSQNLESQLNPAKVLFDQSSKDKNIIDKVEIWMSKHDQDVLALRNWYSQERIKIENTDLLKAFQEFLKTNQLIHDFEQSFWFEDFDKATELSSKKLNDLQDRITRQETQLIFSDLENPASLARWAIQNLHLPLSVEEESMLIHFQSLSRSAPITPSGRYLPFPENLFENPIIVKTKANGFWLELSGIYEFISYIPTQQLNITVDQVRFDISPLATLKQMLEETKKKYRQLQELKNKLESYPALRRSIEIYKNSSRELFVQSDEIAELTPSEFSKYLLIYSSKETLLEDFAIKERNYIRAHNEWMKSQAGNQDLLEKIESINRYIEKQYGSTKIDELVWENEKSLVGWDELLHQFLKKNALSGLKIQQTENRLFKIPPSLTRLHEMVKSIDAEYTEVTRKCATSEEMLASSISKLREAKLNFLKDYKRDFDSNSDAINVDDLPDETKCQQAESKFKLTYDMASEGIEDKTILQGYSVGILAHKLLPTVFQTYQIQEDLIGEQIDQRLSDLTRDLQQIGARKLEILHRVFNEVQTTYNDYLTKVQKINNYLKNKDREITGGNFATLQYKDANGFPDEWMKIFRKRLNSELQNTGLFSTVIQQDIDAIMINIFREAGGKKEAGYEELLNPKSYFDLHFDIRQIDGQSNAGSNGQTYTANALLCLARLSLIEDTDCPGLRIMPIDEAEGLGSNYEMLHALAKKERYQLVTMSIETAGDIKNEGQYIYIMHDNREADGTSYVPPLGIFSNGEITENINEIFDETQ